MKTLFKIFLAPFFWLFQACSPLGNPVDAEKSDSHYYNNSKSQIRYSPMGNWFELGNTAMEVDVESFEVFSKWLSRDKNLVFLEAYPIENIEIDLATFRVKNDDYMSDIGFDKDYAYSFEKVYKNKAQKAEAKIIEGANPKTYIRTDWDWANDGKYHYYKHNQIPADFDSFEILNDYFAKDTSKTFVRMNKKFNSFEAELSTFKILGESNHAIDNNHVYWLPFFTRNSSNVLTIPHTNETEVEFLNRYFLRISNTIYFDGVARPDIDAKSFEIIDHSYAKDSKHVFYKDKTIPNADPESFKQMEGSYKYIDKNGIYHEGKLEEKKPKDPQ